MEDNQIVAQIYKQFNVLHKGYFEVLYNWQQEWLDKRFHPLFFAIPIAMIKWFGNNYIALNICRLIFAILTTFFLFRTVRIRQFSIFESLAFVTIVIVGIQTRAYFRQFCGEPQGMLCLSLAIYFLTANNNNNFWQKYKTFFAILFLICATLTKEAFILMIPPFIFYKIWIYSMDNEIPLKKSIEKNSHFILILLLIFIVEMYLIFHLVGADMGYAGIKSNYFILSKHLLLIKTYYIKTFFFAIPGIFVLIIIIYCFIRKTLPEFLKNINFVYLLILYLLIIVPQFLLHYKSNINERYLFPAVIASALLNVIIIRYLRETRMLQKAVLYLIVLITLTPLAYRCIIRAYYFVDEGKQTQQMIEKIVSSSSLANQKTVYYVAEGITRSLNNSLAIYIKQFYNKHNNYILTNDYSIYTNPIYQGSAIMFYYDAFDTQILDNIKNKNEISCIVLYAEDFENFKNESKSWFSETDFNINSYGRPNRKYGSYWNMLVLSGKNND